ncbi:hypothetical protein G3I34_04080 [Streptomyces sp. SID8014]|uniref:hypothetical protein n=1 Tax=Streptomyces sp. SID8014 TaxID=2706097 RepID=UPI0013BCABE8|nr:hypothetical protein [Streptomyces sp. SID8014]NEC11500.1 hypothetical protein [Streptomyces sp. SID8014]
MGRGKLRLHLAAAPGVGTTCTMLSAAHRTKERGTDVVVAFVEHHDRPRAPRPCCTDWNSYRAGSRGTRGRAFTETGGDAVLGRAPPRHWCT